MSVRCFDLLFPPGSLEGGKGTNDRWLQSISLARETRHVLIGSFLIPTNAPALTDWWILENLHFPSGQPGYETSNSSPIQLDVSAGATKIVTHGGGTLDTTVGSPTYHQYLGTEKHVFPVDGPPGGPDWLHWADNPPNVLGTWNDWVLDCYLKENTGWFDFYLNGSLFASSKTDHPGGISTIYTGLPNVEAWLGSYYPSRSDDGPENIGKTGHVQVALTRHGNDPASALADVPQLYVDGNGKIGWGALQLDLSVVTELPARDPASWVLPAALFPTTPVTPPPVTPPAPPPVPPVDLRTQLTSALTAAQDDFTASDAAMTVARKSLADCYQRYIECNARVDAISAALARLP
jgi:hypothetical protein